MKTGALARYRNVVIALIAGVGLAAASVYLAGVVAALPVPTLPEHFRRAHWKVLIVTLDLVGALPLTFVAWAVGRLLFRTLRNSPRQLWIVVGLPWLVYGCIGGVDYIRSSGYEISRAFSMILSPLPLTAQVISILSVPVGLWWASRFGRAV